jgi:catecholate siderophore receptor
MAYIKSRKHAVARAVPHFSGAAAATLMAIAAPGAFAQSSGALPEVRVQDSAAVLDYKTDTSANPKFTAPLVNTPQTIQVIKEQVIRDQGATTLTEALRNTPGVGTFFLGENGNTNTGDAVFMRGFDSSSAIFVDGIRDLGSVSRDVFNIEQVEVVKGPSGTDVGRTSPTGYINLVTKKPKLEDSFTGLDRLRQRRLQARQHRLEQVAQQRQRHRRGIPPERRGRRRRRGRPRLREEQARRPSRRRSRSA